MSFCSAAKETSSTKWFFSLCILLQFIAGMGTAMLGVAGTSILLRSTDYSASTVAVSYINADQYSL